MINYIQFLKFEKELKQIIRKNENYNTITNSEEITAFLERMKNISNEASVTLWKLFKSHLTEKHLREIKSEYGIESSITDKFKETFIEVSESDNTPYLTAIKSIESLNTFLENTNENLQLMQLLNLINDGRYSGQVKAMEELCRTVQQRKNDIENILQTLADENLRQFIVIRMSGMDHELKNISQDHLVFVMDDFADKLLEQASHLNSLDSIKDIGKKQAESFADRLLHVLDIKTSIKLEANELFKEILTCLLIVKLNRQEIKLDAEVLNLHADLVQNIISKIEKTDTSLFSEEIKNLLFRAIELGLDSSLKEASSYKENRHTLFANPSAYQLSAEELNENNAGPSAAASSSC